MRFPFVAVLAAILVLAGCGPKQMDQEAKDYARSIEFRNARLSAMASYSGHTQHFLKMEVANRGSRAVRHLEIVMYFMDSNRAILLTERAVAISPRLKALSPNETREFKHGFTMPPSWNRVTPNVEIAYLELK